MDIFKFGGASVKDAEGVKNLFNIINTRKENLIIVVSAMGKMTDALEAVCNAYFHRAGETAEALERVKTFHRDIVKELFGTGGSKVEKQVEDLLQTLEDMTKEEPSLSYDYEYDRLICFGELLSTTIVAA